MIQILENYNKLSKNSIYIYFILLFYFLIPGSIKIRFDNNFSINIEDMFIFISTLFLYFNLKKNHEQKKFSFYLLWIIISIYLLAFVFLDSQKSYRGNSYFLYNFIFSFFYTLSLVGLFLNILFCWREKYLLFKLLNLMGIIISLEFLIFFLGYGKLEFLNFFYRNATFDSNGNSLTVFRSIFIGNHITTSVISFVTFLSFLYLEKNNVKKIIFCFILLTISLFNYESRLNIANIFFLLSLISLIKILKIKFDWKFFFIFYVLYFFFSIFLLVLHNNIYQLNSLINISSFADRIILSIFSFDTLINMPIAYGYDNLRFNYTSNNNFILSEFAAIIDDKNVGLSTISALRTNFFFDGWKSISSPHNIIILYFSSYGLWFLYFSYRFIRATNYRHFPNKEMYLLLIFSFLIFSTWNQMWCIDYYLVFIITAMYKIANIYDKKKINN